MSDDVGRKILLIGNYPPPFGGISVHLQGLADKLSLEKEWDVTRLDIEPGSRRKEQVLRAPGSLRLIGRIAVQIYRCDMVHFQTNGHNWKSCLLIVFICLYASLWRKGAVLTLHSGNCPVYVSGLSSVMRSLFLRILQIYYNTYPDMDQYPCLSAGVWSADNCAALPSCPGKIPALWHYPDRTVVWR